MCYAAGAFISSCKAKTSPFTSRPETPIRSAGKHSVQTICLSWQNNVTHTHQEFAYHFDRALAFLAVKKV